LVQIGYVQMGQLYPAIQLLLILSVHRLIKDDN